MTSTKSPADTTVTVFTTKPPIVTTVIPIDEETTTTIDNETPTSTVKETPTSTDDEYPTTTGEVSPNTTDDAPPTTTEIEILTPVTNTISPAPDPGSFTIYTCIDFYEYLGIYTFFSV